MYLRTIRLLALVFCSASIFGATATKVLLVTGGHGFQREEFFKVFSENKNIAYTHAEHQRDADAFERPEILGYDVVVLYDMPKTITDAQKTRFTSLFERGIGLVVLHHALCSYQQWPEYEKLIGGRYPEPSAEKSGVVTKDVGYQHDVEVPVTILAKNHPITSGVSDFTIHDEIYWGFRVGSDVTPLIGTAQEKSGKTLGWTRQEGKSRVVYLQLGHDAKAYENENYRKLVAQSIDFVAKR